MYRMAFLLLPLCLPALAGCGVSGSADGTGGTLVLTGSSTVAPLAAEIGRRFEERHPGTRIDVQTGGSSRGIADVRRGVADIGMASRALRDEEADLHAFLLARDGIGILTNRDNPVTELSTDEIKRIFTGRVTRWAEVGGRDAPITVVNKAQGRSTLELFLDHFEIDPRAIHASVVIGDNEQGIKTVAGNPDAIGYVSLGAAEYASTHGVPVQLLPLDGVAATTANVRNGTFPLSRPLNLVTPEEPTGLAKEFLDFARSAEVHDLVRELYFVPID